MILSDKSIKNLLLRRELKVEPLTEKAIQSASLDCHLDSHFLLVEDRKMSSIDLDKEVIYKKYEGEEIILPPHSFLLACTKECIHVPSHITAFVEGRSSIGRIGLFIQNAGWVDPGFKGQITLELYNANSLPIRLKSGRRICQLVFCKLDQPVLSSYQGKYQGQRHTTGSRIHEDAKT